MSAAYSGDAVLDIMSKYAPRRNRSIEKLIRKFIFDDLPDGSSVLEFGAGKGEFIFRFTETQTKLFAVETDDDYRKKLSQTVTTFSSIDEIKTELDAVYLIDVLEHIEHDQEILNRIYSKLKKNGRLFIYVPARMELYSQFDRSIGHFRRYSIDELKTKITAAKFSIQLIRYHELLGYFAMRISKYINKRDELKSGQVRFYDFVLVPLTNFIERFVKIPVGKSIFMSARKEL